MSSSSLILTALFAVWTGQTPEESETLPDGEVESPFTAEQLRYLEAMKRELESDVRRLEAQSRTPLVRPREKSTIEVKGEAYTKFLYRNNSSQGCVTYGNPHPRGDNFSGDNGACPELAISLLARPISQVEAGFRLQSRYGMQFADYFENGDLRDRPDGSSESLGQNHSGPIQLRGIYVRVSEPLPFIDWFHAGTDDLSYWDAFTVGKIRYIERFNAKGLFLRSSIPDVLDVLIARIALPKLWGTANYNSLDDPAIVNPFWARDAVYAAQLKTAPDLIPDLELTLNGAFVLDEEADTDDPDAPGSINTADLRDGVTAMVSRHRALNASLTAAYQGFDFMSLRGLLAVSHNAPDIQVVSNLAAGSGFTNVVYDAVTDLAGTLRVEIPEIGLEGLGLKLEYFNIGADFNAIVGTRTEGDVLLTDGLFGGGQLPTLNVANELIDFNDRFYESIIGWHGGTGLVEYLSNLVGASLEFSFIEYNTDLQGRDMTKYPDFGGSTGYTETDLYSYANTTDRGRDPRAVYAENQARRTLLLVGKLAFKPDLWPGARFELKGKTILDRDLRDETTEVDDYDAMILQASASAGAELFERLNLTLGVQLDYWDELGRSELVGGGQPLWLDYKTTKLRPFIRARYVLGPFVASYHLEAVQRDVEVSVPTQTFSQGLIVRSIGSLMAQF